MAAIVSMRFLLVVRRVGGVFPGHLRDSQGVVLERLVAFDFRIFCGHVLGGHPPQVEEDGDHEDDDQDEHAPHEVLRKW